MDWDLLGHEWAVRLLQHHIARSEARHAYLFAGPPGVGRRSLAVRFAQALNCTQPPEPGIPCRICRSCSQIEKLQHPDLSILQSDSDNRTIKVEAVRELQRSLSLAPYQANYCGAAAALPGCHPERPECPAENAGRSPAARHPAADG
jgi:DNA polymerase-3 subunit delta'